LGMMGGGTYQKELKLGGQGNRGKVGPVGGGKGGEKKEGKLYWVRL